MAAALLAGAVLGLSVAAPFGPISLICVQHSLNRGYRYGMMAGLGAATAQGLFAAAAIIGAEAASVVLKPMTNTIHLLSAVILVGLGARTILRARSVRAVSRAVSLRAAYASSLVLALSNPMTIIPYLALATVAAGNSAANETLSLWSIPGIILAVATWYTGLSFMTALLRHGMSARVAWLLNLGAGGMLIGLGALIGRDLLPFVTG